MGAWQSLPEDLPPEVRHFVEQLRRLKDATGLSLAALGARTAYSKSSWHRYLNAVQPPPRQAVTALCGIAGLGGPEAERVGVRWELAVQAWPRQATAPEQPAGAEEYEDDPTLPWWEEQPPAPSKGPRGANRMLLAAVLLLLVLVLVAGVGVVVLG
ncbi:helix-turn-helix domain-containing protein [Streptomyces justiciae]|uniref:helix-turn-helix domain-containing protein n=1 Tax=Streptomyces justiciae TaxID=2780140 RepID=UPI0021180A5F|nr:helix-turn-helix transcriptional regulator [Streptomyces justiciae]MCW8384342.1 helix-turn-helix domain-containing protein [Streptomyces justiciae]